MHNIRKYSTFPRILIDKIFCRVNKSLTSVKRMSRDGRVVKVKNFKENCALQKTSVCKGCLIDTSNRRRRD